MKHVYLCAYGDVNHHERGIVRLDIDLETGQLNKEFVLPLKGKCNLVTEYKNHLYLSVKYPEGSRIEVYDEKYQLIKSYPSEYFYSYGQVVENKFLLASYESGVDSVFDFEKEEFTAHCIHKRENYEGKTKSHYIQKLKDGQIVGVENGHQQFIVYEDMNLNVKKIVEYPPVNIRLLSVHPDGKTAYMNTEYSNELIVLETENWSVVDRWQMADEEGWYSGGNAISEDGAYVCASVRGQDRIHVFKPYGNHILPVGSFGCGRIPRDLVFVEDLLFVSCTDDNKVEVYDFANEMFEKIAEIDVAQPVTFGMKS